MNRPRRSLSALVIWRLPVLIAVVSSIALFVALLGDHGHDRLAIALLGTPLAVALVLSRRRR